MTFAEALRELGVEPTATAKEAQLSYLRRIELHRAEEDAEATERVREAYELVFPLLQARERELEVGNDEVAPEDPSTPVGETEPSRTNEDPKSLVPEVHEWLLNLRRKEVAAAIPKILASLEKAGRLRSSAHIPGDIILGLVAELAASGDAIRARSLTAALRAWVDSLPSPRGAFSVEAEPRWVLLEELSRVEPELSYPTYMAFARLLAESDPSLTDLLVRHQAVHPEQAARDHALLTAKAPMLAQAFGGFLIAAEPAQNPRQTRAAQGWLWLMALIIGANVLRICSDAQRPPVPGEYSAEHGAFQTETNAPPTEESRIEKARLDLSRWLSPRGEEQYADSAAHALLHLDCQAAHRALTQLDEHTRELPDEAQPSVRALWLEFERKCSGRP
jgi:hypothetical protein